ncbi:MAG TPA: class I SAM-dependent methyltransferase, partial [Phenylobacterium sp.]|nr:class I SAM-dependent methyltransferase [Phenylobacterium sp.]
MDFDGPTRFKSDASENYGGFRDAAVDYIANLAVEDRRGLLEKPLDWNPGNTSYFLNMQQLLCGLQAMQLTPKARIMEVGSGAGWTTEILASLAFRVDCIEPSAEMIEVARQRVRAHLAHHGVEHLVENLTWQCSTIEECEIADESVDAVIYFESFHHVIDEHAAVERTLRVLKPGGRLLILGDSNWIPGNAQQETAWNEEMQAYGTLESPFTDAYLLWLLRRSGFVDAERHHLVSGLVPVSRETEPVRAFAQLDATWVNLVLARKPTAEDLADLPPEPEARPEPEAPPEPVVAAPPPAPPVDPAPAPPRP